MRARFALGAWLLLGACAVDSPDEPTTPDPLPDEVLEPFEQRCADWPGATVPLNDAHVHARGELNGHDNGDWALVLLDDMNQHGVERAVVLPPPYGDNALEQELGLAVEEAWGALAARCARVDAMVSAFDPTDPAIADEVIARLDRYPYAGLGALELDDLSVDLRGGALPALYAAVAERGLSIQFHARRPTLPLARQEELLALADEWPQIPFLWFGFLDPALGPQVPDNVFRVRAPSELICEGCPQPSPTGRRVLLGTDSPPAGYELEDDQPWASLGQGAEYARDWLADQPAAFADALAANHAAVFPRR